MEIKNLEITLYQDSQFIVGALDSVKDCFIHVKKSKEHTTNLRPIVIKSGGTFEFNTVESEIPEPVWLDKESGDDFQRTGNNYYHQILEEQ